MDKYELFSEAKKTIVDANEDKSIEVIKEAQKRGIDLLELLQEGFGMGNQEIGEKFERGLISLPELLFSSEVMKNVTDFIVGNISNKEIEKKGILLIATVEGDVHDIGKGLVASTLRAGGFEVIDLGREVPVSAIVEAAETYRVDIIATSALLTSTLSEQKKLEQYLRKYGLREKYITMVGGAPCTPRWAKKIGADAYSEDAIDAVKKATELMEKHKHRKLAGEK